MEVDNHQHQDLDHSYGIVLLPLEERMLFHPDESLMIHRMKIAKEERTMRRREYIMAIETVHGRQKYAMYLPFQG